MSIIGEEDDRFAEQEKVETCEDSGIQFKRNIANDELFRAGNKFGYARGLNTSKDVIRNVRKELQQKDFVAKDELFYKYRALQDVEDELDRLLNIVYES